MGPWKAKEGVRVGVEAGGKLESAILACLGWMIAKISNFCLLASITRKDDNNATIS